MKRASHFRSSPWFWLAVLVCVVTTSGCQDGSGPNLVLAPQAKPGDQGVKPPRPAPADPAVAYVTNGELRVMDADGANQTTVFIGTWLISLPSWSPDGQGIAFTDGINSPDLWLVDIAVVNGAPRGTNARVLLDRGAGIHHAAWSPVGDRIAFVDGALNTIEAIAVDGGASVVLYESPSGALSYPTWSPDASRIAFVEGGAIRVLDVGTGAATTVLEAGWGQQFGGGPGFLDWARTQDALAFSVGSQQSNDLAIYTIELPMDAPVFIAGGHFPAWSPDDEEILFAAGRNDRLTKVVLATNQTVAVGARSAYWPDWRRF